MSMLLTFALVLLVIVVGLILLQRRGAPAAESGAPDPAASSTDPGGPYRASGELRLDDPALGVLTFNPPGLWHGTTFVLDGDEVIVDVGGNENGPAPALRAMLAAAGSEPGLLARATPIIAAELARRGIHDAEIVPYEIAAESRDGVPTGYLWFEVEGVGGEIGVSSRDDWRTLTLETVG